MARVSSARIQSFKSTSNQPLAPRCLRSVTLLWIGLVFWSIPLASSADPITITSGRLTGAEVTLYGPGFALTNADFLGENDDLFGPGLEIKYVSPFANSYPLAARLSFAVDSGHLLLDDQAMLINPFKLFVAFELTVLAGSAVPVWFQDRQDGPFVRMRSEATGPFTLSGRMVGISRETAQQVFERDVNGRGTVRAGFSYWVSDPSPPSPWVSYTFEQPAAPVPEPATLALLGGGLVGLLCRRCKGGRK